MPPREISVDLRRREVLDPRANIGGVAYVLKSHHTAALESADKAGRRLLLFTTFLALLNLAGLFLWWQFPPKLPGWPVNCTSNQDAHMSNVWPRLPLTGRPVT